MRICVPQSEIVYTSSSAGKVKKQRVAIKLQVPGGAWWPKNVTCSTSTDWLTNWAKTRQDDPREHQFFNRQALYSNTVKGERYDFWKVLSAIRGQRDAGIWWEVEIGKTVETYQGRHSHKDNSSAFNNSVRVIDRGPLNVFVGTDLLKFDILNIGKSSTS